jgi:CBS domain-containing protein
VSASFGSIMGHAIDAALPGPHVAAGAFALVAMAATFGSAARAPFAAIVFVFELTRDYDAILPLMLATVIAEMIARSTLPQSLMTEKLSRRNITVPGDVRADVLTTTKVGDVMTTPVVTLSADSSVDDAVEQFLAGAHSAYPIVDEAAGCIGVLTRSDVLAIPDDDEPGSLRRHAGGAVVSIAPEDTVLDALHRMLDDGVDHLPVLADGRLVGICTRTDVLQARHRAIDAEHRQRGWLPLAR